VCNELDLNNIGFIYAYHVTISYTFSSIYYFVDISHYTLYRITAE